MHDVAAYMITGMESRSFDRVPAFTDAVVAIALTLLVLPLSEFARDVAHVPVGQWFGDHWEDLLAFLISFLVIALYWRIHHQLFDYIERVDSALLGFNTAWLLGIVFFPVTTAMVAGPEPGHGAAVTVVYLCNLLYVTLAGVAMVLWIQRHPQLQRAGTAAAIGGHLRRGIIVSSVIAITTALAVPFGQYALLALWLLPLAQRLANRVKASPQTR
jgi:uncharacterized membrane protein